MLPRLFVRRLMICCLAVLFVSGGALAHAQPLTVLRGFTFAESSSPRSRLVQDRDGRLYGTTYFGGPRASGGVFRINPDGSDFRFLHYFDHAIDGSTPGALLLARDGRLYGVTNQGGGGTASGTIFRMNLDGSGFVVLRQLTTADGLGPGAGLTQTASGRIFGTTTWAGRFGMGTVFALNADGTGFTVIHDFTGGLGGAMPGSELVQGVDGRLFGATLRGGGLEVGVVYRIEETGANFTVVKSFGAAEGLTPAGLMRGSDGFLYGTSTGAVFRLNPDGSGFTLLRSLSTFEGASPRSPLVEFSDGRLYGVNYSGGAGGVGNVFRLSRDGRDYEVLYTFGANPAAGTLPLAGLMVGADGRMYGSTAAGGVPDAGAVFAFAPPVPPLVSSPTTVAVTAGERAVSFSVEASGSPAPTFTWQRKAAGTNVWLDLTGVFPGASTATLLIPTPLFVMNGDEFRVIASNAYGSATSAAARLDVAPSTRLANVSVRAELRPEQPLTLGFVLVGERKPLLVRAVGPGLAAFLPASTTVAADPALVLYDRASVVVARNANWEGNPTLATAFSRVGAFALAPDSLDAAVMQSFDGSVTAQASTSGRGIALVEGYDMEPDSTRRLVNVSSLYRVGSGSAALVLGFVIRGAGTKNLLVRGVGPGLVPFGVTDVVGDPVLTVYTERGGRIDGNDDWPAVFAETFRTVRAFPLAPGSRDAAVRLTLSAGAYTVELTGAAGTTGNGLIEVYELPD